MAAWIVTASGVALQDEDELRASLEGTLVDESNLEALVKDIKLARLTENPYDIMDGWAETEPGVMQWIRFESLSSELARPTRELPEFNESLETILARRFIDGLGDNFLISPDRSIRINPDNPPSIEQAYEAVSNILQNREFINKLENFHSWSLGALVDELENYFGENFEVGQIMAATEKSYSAIMCAVGVYRAFGQNRFDLSFTHHREVFYLRTDSPECKAKAEDKHKILGVSERLKLNLKEQRQIINYVRENGWTDRFNDAADKEELLQECQIRDARQKYLFRLNGKWFKTKGLISDIPSSADEIINVGSMTDVSRDGGKIEEWQQVVNTTATETGQ